MKRGGSFLQGYNRQAVVDEENQIILAEGVTNQAPDQEHLVPMMKRVSRRPEPPSLAKSPQTCQFQL